MPRLSTLLVTISLTLLLSACGGGDSDSFNVTPPAADNCTVPEQNQFIIDLMRDIYYWLDELPATISAADFDSPEATMRAMEFADLDRFSGIRDQAANDAFFSESQFIGVGITTTIRDDRLFIAQAFGDGPAAAAGLQRGYEILAINGRTVADILAAEDSIGDQFGENEIGVNVDLQVRDLNASVVDVSFGKALVTIETVTVADVLDLGGVPTAYLSFRNFVSPSFDALDDAFAMFAAEGATEVILDLRYNGGGLVSVADHLASLLSGSIPANSVYSKRDHNRNNTARNTTTNFLSIANTLDIDSLTVITLGGTASASELVINGLRPYMDVRIVGQRSFGKPVGAYGFDFCDKTAVPTAFATVNSLDQGDYFDGFDVDCAVDDDLTQPLGSELEAMLAEAIVLQQTGQCSAMAAQAKQVRVEAANKRRAQQRAMNEFDQLRQAF